MTNDSLKILIVAGETSGDLHGAALVSELKKKIPSLIFYGIGGRKMEEEGVNLLERADNMAVIGFTEVLSKYLYLRGVFNKTVQWIIDEYPARAILIDYPGFNLKLSKILKKYKIPVTYYIPPQLWAWNEKRIEVIRKNVEQIICIFPFEKDWYSKRGIKIDYVGHPFLDLNEIRTTKHEYLSGHKIPVEAKVISLFPGSRQKEVNRHLPIMLESVQCLKKEFRQLYVIIGQAKNVKIKVPDEEYLKIERKIPVLALKHSDITLAASGTVTLEAAINEIPSIVIYKLSGISSFWAKRLVKVKFVSMPNLIANKSVYPELLLKEAASDRIIQEIKKILVDEKIRKQILRDVKIIKDKLGRPGASKRAAGLIAEKIKVI